MSDDEIIQAQVNGIVGAATLSLTGIKNLLQPVDCRGKSGLVIDCGGFPVLQSGTLTYPQNKSFVFGALLKNAPAIGEPVYDFDDPDGITTPDAVVHGTITAGQSVFVGSTTLSAGNVIAVALGRAITDANLSDVTYIATVKANAGGSLTLDTPCPNPSSIRSIVNGTVHQFYIITALGDNSGIQNAYLDYPDSNTKSGEHVSVVWARNFTATGLQGRWSICIYSYYVNGLTVQNCSGQPIFNSDALYNFTGRFVSLAGTKEFVIANSTINTSTPLDIVYTEANTHSGVIQNMNYMVTGASVGTWDGGWLFCDGSVDIATKTLTLTAPVGDLPELYADGTSNLTNSSNITFSAISVNTPLSQADMRGISDGEINGIPLGKLQTNQYTLSVPALDGQYINLAHGVVRRLYVRPPVGVTTITWRPNNAGPSISITGGTWNAIVDGITSYLYNDPSSASIAIAAVNFSTGTTGLIEVISEAFPAGQTLP